MICSGVKKVPKWNFDFGTFNYFLEPFRLFMNKMLTNYEQMFIKVPKWGPGSKMEKIFGTAKSESYQRFLAPGSKMKGLFLLLYKS